MEGHIKICHKYKDTDNKTRLQTVYEGPCVYAEKASVREVLGGVESSSGITVRVHTVKGFDIACGDLCILNGKEYTVRRCAGCTGAMAGFSHIQLILR